MENFYEVLFDLLGDLLLDNAQELEQLVQEDDRSFSDLQSGLRVPLVILHQHRRYLFSPIVDPLDQRPLQLNLDA